MLPALFKFLVHLRDYGVALDFGDLMLGLRDLGNVGGIVMVVQDGRLCDVNGFAASSRLLPGLWVN